MLNVHCLLLGSESKLGFKLSVVLVFFQNFFNFLQDIDVRVFFLTAIRLLFLSTFRVSLRHENLLLYPVIYRLKAAIFVEVDSLGPFGLWAEVDELWKPNNLVPSP